MPKYTTDIIAGYALYFTSKCIVEAMHVHASDKSLTESGSAKLFVLEDGNTKVQEHGRVSKADMIKIQRYIKKNYKLMYKKWRQYSTTGYYHGK